MFACVFKMAAANLKLAKRCVVELIVSETLCVLNCMDLGERALRPFALRYGNRPVERHDW